MENIQIKSKRYLALDVMRGITISGMILVNTPGSWSYVYSPLMHSAWHGCTPTDLVFPFFLFVVGVSMFFSFAKYGRDLNKQSLFKVVKRTVLIFLIGLFLNSFPQWIIDFSKLRIMGVLQRIALAYGIASLIVLSMKPKSIVAIGISILTVYWAILYFAATNNPYSLEHNVCTSVDLFVLGEQHIYHGFGIAFDPEGLLSTLPSIVTVLIGYLVGGLIKNTNTKNLINKLLYTGVILTVLGYVWSYVFPINKPLWTSSYVLYTAGLAILVLTILIWIIDVKGLKKWSSFFVVFGVNPLFIFALSGLWVKCMVYLIKFTNESGESINGYKALYTEVFVPLSGNMNGSLLFALSHIIVFWFIAWVLYRNHVFIKV